MHMKFKRYINKTLAFTLTAALGVSAILSSCSDDDEKSGAVVLESFGPTGVQHGEMIQFIGQNLDQVSSIMLPGVEVTKQEFERQSSGLIELIVPDEALAGKVILKTPQGEVESKTVLSFEVPVEISSITPEAKPGETITISGSFVNWINEITFNDGQTVTEFVSKSVDELVVTVPMEAQTGFLQFSSGGTIPQVFTSEAALIVTVPTVSELSPIAVKHTDELTITGTDLDLITSIVFKGDKTVAEFVSQTETQIVVEVPVGALKGTLTLKQASPITVTTSDEITIILPVGTSISPKPAIPGTDNITITGTNLDLVAELVFPSVANPIPASSFINHSATQIVVAVPADAKSGGIIYNSIHGYSNNLGVTLVIPSAGPPPLAITMYDETVAFGGGDWSWNVGTSNSASNEQFYSGDVSWKFVTPSDGGVSVGGMTPIDASAMTYFSFSVFGGPGTNGKNIACILNDSWGDYNTVTMVEGQWTEFKVPLSSYPGVNKTAITRWILKVEGMAGSTIYVDRIGFE